jgi:Tfp pilus assembly protein PilV
MNLMQTASERTNEANQLQLEQTTSQLQEAQAEVIPLMYHVRSYSSFILILIHFIPQLTQLDEEACQALSAARASLEEQHNEASRREAECQTALQQAQWAATQCESEAAALADALYADREVCSCFFYSNRLF